ncbi:MAG: N-acetylmuramoyl-L-alanine amidase-like domain-containing protein [Gemmatimonadota bacterium]
MRRRLPYILLALALAALASVPGIDRLRDAEPAATIATTAAATDPAVQAEAEDREIVWETVAFAREHGLYDAPIGEAIAGIGRTFVGTPYVPHVLEAPGPERLIVNLRELDCVTFVENVLAIARVARDDAAAAGADTGDPAAARADAAFDAGGRDAAGQEHARARDAVFDAFTDELRSIRYRGGELDGYASRLHYFSEWIADAVGKGLVRDVTRELGGAVDAEPIDFMSTHPDAYRKLSDPAALDAIREVEARLGERTRYYIPESRIADVAPRIRDGDIIAATSSVDGLDVAHTGIALWIDGELHLMHAPLVGRAVEISVEPLADRIRGIEGQDGIMVARPL